MLRTLRYRGVLYHCVEAVHHPLQKNETGSLATELEVAKAHLEEVVADAERVTADARKLLQSLREGAHEVASCIKETGGVDPRRVRLLHPDGRQDGYMVPLRSMEKANRMLNYTVDASIAAIKTTIEQVDAMVDDWQAALETQNAPNTSRELTAPMVMTDSPADDVPTM
jgi:hypothetical protein